MRNVFTPGAGIAYLLDNLYSKNASRLSLFPKKELKVAKDIHDIAQANLGIN